MAADKTNNAVGMEKDVDAEEEEVAQGGKASVATEDDFQPDPKVYDWTQTYEKWDAWEDPEERAKQERETRERRDRASKTSVGCNHDHSAEQKLMDMTTAAKLAACDDFRVLGNLFYGHGQYQRAAFHYHRALVYFEYVFTDTDEEETEAEALKLKLLLNFAACRLKTVHLDDAVHHLNQALGIDVDNVKALYRRAQAYRLMDKFDLAQRDLARAVDLSRAADESQSVASHLMQEKRLLQAKTLAYKLRTKQVSDAMFGNKGEQQVTALESTAHDNGLCPPDVGSMTLNLSKNLDTGVMLSRDEFECLSTLQPSTRGLEELQTLIKKLAERTTETETKNR